MEGVMKDLRGKLVIGAALLSSSWALGQEPRAPAPGADTTDAVPAASANALPTSGSSYGVMGEFFSRRRSRAPAPATPAAVTPSPAAPANAVPTSPPPPAPVWPEEKSAPVAAPAGATLPPLRELTSTAPSKPADMTAPAPSSAEPAPFAAGDIARVSTRDLTTNASLTAIPQGLAGMTLTTDARTTTVAPLHLINSRRFKLHYALKDAPGSACGVDLWCTADGRTWHRHDGSSGQSPYPIGVAEDGVYGITLRARLAGGSSVPPQPGEAPQVWVEVDSTRPIVRLVDVREGTVAGARSVSLRWESADKNLESRPVSLSFAEQPQGPWRPITGNLDSSGTYVWQLPLDVPPRLFMRVEARDRAGNVGTAQTPEPLVTAAPSVAIVGIEADGS
jgi:hypothetical protein